MFDLALAPSLDMQISDNGATRTITHVETRLLLQRRRSDGDCKRWRTVLSVRHTHMRLLDQWVAVAMVLDAGVEWRLTHADGTPITEQKSESSDSK